MIDYPARLARHIVVAVQTTLSRMEIAHFQGSRPNHCWYGVA